MKIWNLYQSIFSFFPVWEWAKIQLLCSKCHFLPLRTSDDVFYSYPTIHWTELMRPHCCLCGIVFTQRIVVPGSVHIQDVLLNVHKQNCELSVCFYAKLDSSLVRKFHSGLLSCLDNPMALFPDWIPRDLQKKKKKRYLPWGLFFSCLTVLLSFDWVINDYKFTVHWLYLFLQLNLFFCRPEKPKCG